MRPQLENAPDWSEAIASAGDWTPDLVKAELAEAIKIVMRTAGRTGPKAFGNGMPEFLVDLDIGTKEEPGLAGNKREEDVRRPPSAKAITRAEAAIRWPIDYLDHLPGPRGMLRIWLKATAFRKPWSRFLKDRGIPLATAKRARSKAFAAIAAGLNRDGVPL